MHLYLCQHGDALKEEIDPARPLSGKGRQDVIKTAAVLPSTFMPKAIHHSGKLRAKQTAEIIGDKFKITPSATDGLNPMDDPAIWRGRLKDMKEDTMLVGHLPHMGKLASLLLCGNPDSGIISFQMGCVVCLKREDDRWSIAWMIAPRIS